MDNEDDSIDVYLSVIVCGVFGLFVFSIFYVFCLLLANMFGLLSAIGSILGYVFYWLSYIPLFIADILGAEIKYGNNPFISWYVYSFYGIFSFIVAQLICSKKRSKLIVNKTINLWKNLDKPPNDPYKKE